tara:strand:+ start:451 stop:555 length:105 start_codon:yes stop_codon:yes gene_type:complete
MIVSRKRKNPPNMLGGLGKAVATFITTALYYVGL